jgi:hypothetical protein
MQLLSMTCQIVCCPIGDFDFHSQLFLGVSRMKLMGTSAVQLERHCSVRACELNPTEPTEPQYHFTRDRDYFLSVRMWLPGALRENEMDAWPSDNLTLADPN